MFVKESDVQSFFFFWVHIISRTKCPLASLRQLQPLSVSLLSLLFTWFIDEHCDFLKVGVTHNLRLPDIVYKLKHAYQAKLKIHSFPIHVRPSIMRQDYYCQNMHDMNSRFPQNRDLSCRMWHLNNVVVLLSWNPRLLFESFKDSIWAFRTSEAVFELWAWILMLTVHRGLKAPFT